MDSTSTNLAVINVDNNVEEVVCSVDVFDFNENEFEERKRLTRKRISNNKPIILSPSPSSPPSSLHRPEKRLKFDKQQNEDEEVYEHQQEMETLPYGLDDYLLEPPPKLRRLQRADRRQTSSQSPYFQSPERNGKLGKSKSLQAYLRKENAEELFIGSQSLTQQQLKDLVNKCEWLSCDHINAYFTILNSEYESNIHAFSTYFYVMLMKDNVYSYSNVIRWTKKIDIFSKQFIYVPINVNDSHWILAVIKIRERRIELWDSLGNRHIKTVDDHSCGVFVCMFAKLLSDGIDDETIIEEAFDEQKIREFRILMAEKILSKSILCVKDSDQEND
ncbi:8224_t:CDS:2 [Entrophospora sp. SA101]|nr:14560_t:CDS:2 [Entrophospora sp. SA101]CAJ0754018.1 8224_t:CDS:2 [Entrophospora sp. SA101]